MMRWGVGTVKKVLRRARDSEEIAVIMEGGSEALAFHDVQVHGSLKPGDKVLLNVTAAELGLGTGGVHFVAARLTGIDIHADDVTADDVADDVTADVVMANVVKGDGVGASDDGDDPDDGDFSDPFRGHVFRGHMMKMRYSPFQRAVAAAEEANSPWHARFAPHNRLGGMPVLIGELHSMLPAALCWLRFKQTSSPPRIAYVMSDGGALPISFSHHVRTVKSLGWLCGTITYGHAYGGDVETINKYTALQAAKHVLDADLAIVVMGPGIAGTGTAYGHTSMETGELVNAVAAMGGRPIAIPRLSFHDGRARHTGLSHHFLYAMADAALHRADVPLPAHLPPDKKEYVERQIAQHPGLSKHRFHWVDHPTLEQVEASLQHYPFPITTMARSLRDDPFFFLAVAAAAEWTRCECFGAVR